MSAERSRRGFVVLIAALLTALAASGYGVWIYSLDAGALIYGLLVLLCVAPGTLFFSSLRDPSYLRSLKGIGLFLLCAYLSMVLCSLALVTARGDLAQFGDLRWIPLLFLMVAPPATLMLLLVWGLDWAIAGRRGRP